MGASSSAATLASVDAQAAGEASRTSSDPLPSLCLLGRLHHLAAEPAALRHWLGKSRHDTIDNDDLLLAARHIGLKARRTHSTPERLGQAPLPVLALMNDGRWVVLAQCDARRVLIHDGNRPAARPSIEPLDTFAAQWSGELLFATSRSSLAGELAKFDFSWFVPALVKYRRLFAEALLVSLFLQLFALVTPLFFQAVMDKVLVHRGMTTLDVLVIGLVIVVVFESVLSALRNYVVNATGDVTTEFANEGVDTVLSGVTRTLGADLENLTLTGTGAINGTGNTLDNVLTGNAATNALTGNAGNDTLDGGAGADTLIGGSGADRYRFGVGRGIDTVQENDAAAGVKDRVELIGLNQANVGFQRNANNLELLIAGNSVDKLVIKDWYLGTQYRVEEFAFADGTVVTDAQVQSLVSAMAQFNVQPALDGATLLRAPRMQYGPAVLAANAF